MNIGFLNKVSPYWLLVLTTLFWAGNFNVGRSISTDVPPLGLSFWRWAVAFAILLPFAYGPMKQQWPVLKEHFKIVFVLSLFGVAAFNSLVYLALQTTTAINVAMIQSTCPVLIIILSTLFWGAKASPQQWLGVLISLVGAGVILIRGDFTVLSNLDFKAGDLWMLAAAICWAIYTALLRKLPTELKGLPFLGYSMLLGVIMILPFYLAETFSGSPMPLSTTSLSGIAYVSVFASLLAFLFWNNAAGRIGANQTGQFLHLIPVFGITIATLLLDEKLENFHFIGILLVATGLLLANLTATSLQKLKK
jgi:drug/metabolite transporter (DMT)-like permease